MKQTTNLKLNKPDYEDIADVAKLNENSDILDRELNDRLSKTKGGTVEKDLTVNGKLNVNGETKVTGTMQTADVFVGGWNTSTRKPEGTESSLRVNGTLETYGEIHTNGETIDCGNITSKAIEAQGDIRTSTNAQISGGLTVNGTTTLNNQMRLNGTLDMSGRSLKAGDGTFTGTLRADSDLITHNVKPKETDIYSLGNSSKFYKKAYINGITSKNGLNIDSDVTMSEGITVEKDLTVNGKLNANGETKVSGTMQTADVFVGGWDTVTRNPNSDKSSLRVNGTLETYGEIHTNGETIDCGNITSKAIEAQGDIRTSANAQISGGLTVNGTTTINNQMRLNGTLDMTGQSLKAGDGTFTGTLRANSDLITHNVKPETDNTNTLGNSSKFYKKAYINGITSKNGLTVDSDVTINGALKANNLSADEALSKTSVNPVQNKVITAAILQKSDIGHKHTMNDIVFSVEADLKCLYTYTVHADGVAPDEGNHVVGWQVVNYSEFPASTLSLAIEKLDSFEFGGNTYNTKSPAVMGYGVTVTELPSSSAPSWTAEYDTLRFYTYGGYVRYIASGEYPENNLIYGVEDTETFSLEFESNGSFNVTPDSELNSSSTNAVQNKVIKAALDKKAEKSHTHSLTDNTIMGTLPISKGGTGGTSAADARSKLGLGSAATYNAGGSITTGNNSLVTGGTVAAFFNAQNFNKRTHIVIAAYDTKNPLKANADYTCTSSNASSVIKTAISAIKDCGRIELLDGTYQMQYNEEYITIERKNITIEGSGYGTVIKQPIDTGAGEAKPVFEINAQNVTIKNMMICDAVVSSPVSMIVQKAQGAVYENVFFIYGASEPSTDNVCIEGQNDCNFTRIQNCRVYKGFQDTDKYMFDFSRCTSFGGIIGGNISSGYEDISILFANESQKNNTAIYGHKAVKIATK